MNKGISKNEKLSELCKDSKYSKIKELYSDRNYTDFNDIFARDTSYFIWHCKKYNKDWVRQLNGMLQISRFIDCESCKNDNKYKYCGIDNNRCYTFKERVETDKKLKELKSWWSEKDNNDIRFENLKFGDYAKYWNWRCPIGHKFSRTIDRLYQNTSCPICSEHSRISFSEILIAVELKKVYPNLKTTVTKDTFDWLGKMSLDIYLPDFNIAIEFDGPKHKNKEDTDVIKNKLCLSHNINIIRIRSVGLSSIDYCINLFLKCDGYEEIASKAKDIVNYINKQYNRKDSLTINLDEDLREVSYLFYKSIRENSLGTKYPELIKEFDFDKNNGLNPYFIPMSSNIKYFWKCNICGAEWEQSVNERTSKGHAHPCPYCSGYRVKAGLNDIGTTHMEILKDWDYTKNNKMPEEFSSGSHYMAFWKCHVCGYEWNGSIKNRCNAHTGCPSCHYNYYKKERKDLTKFYSKYNKYSLKELSNSSNKIVNFECPYCGKVWSEPFVNAQNRKYTCKYCKRN